jgi:hypothetical protein
MARYEHLPIYRKSFDVLLWIENALRGSSRHHKYSIGSDLRTPARSVVRRNVRTNQQRDRRTQLEQLRDTIEELLNLIRLTKETRAFASLAAYQFCANEALQIGRRKHK